MKRQLIVRRVNEKEIRLASPDGTEQFVWYARDGEKWEQGRTYTVSIALDPVSEPAEGVENEHATQEQNSDGDTGDPAAGSGQA